MKRIGRLAALVGAISVIASFAIAVPAHAAGERVTYIYETDTVARDSFKTLLELNGYTFASVALADVATYDFSTTNLIMVADDTATYSFDNATLTGTWDWGSSEQVAAVNNSAKPVLGIGEGGGAYFDEIDLAIGLLDSWYDDTGAALKPVDTTASIWTTPNTIPIVGGLTGALFSVVGERMSVYLPNAVSGVTGIAREETDLTHYPLISQTAGGVTHTMWGYRSSPATMLATGSSLFINVAVSALGTGGGAGGGSSISIPEATTEETTPSTAQETTPSTTEGTAIEAAPATENTTVSGGTPTTEAAPTTEAQPATGSGSGSTGTDEGSTETAEPAPAEEPIVEEPIAEVPAPVTEETVVSASYNDGTGTFRGQLFMQDAQTIQLAMANGSDSGCHALRMIKLRKVTPGTDPVLAKALTGSLGRWKIAGFSNAKGVYYVQAPAVARADGTTCGADRSEFMRIR